MAPSVTSRSAQWDPIKVLNLDVAGIGHSVHCHGLTLKRVRCTNPIGRTWHEDIRRAHRILASRPLNQISERDLVPLASALLCKHQHSGKQDYELAARWWCEMDLFFTQNASFDEEIDSIDELRAQLAAARDEAETHRRLCVDAATELMRSQTRLASQDQMLSAQKALLASRDAKINELSRENESLITQISAITTERDVTARSLKADLQKSKATLEEERLQNDRNVSEIKEGHEETERKLKAELSDMSNARRSRESELQHSRATNCILTKEKRAQGLKITALQDSIKQLKLNEYFRTVRHQLEIRMWQRHSEGLRADNQTLLEQQRDLQKVASEFGQDLQSLQNTLSPLKLENVKKGLHTVFSIRPMRIRALRIST